MARRMNYQQQQQKTMALKQALARQGAAFSDAAHGYDPYKFWNEKTGRYDHPKSPHMRAEAASASSHGVGIKETASQWLDRQLYSVRRQAWA